MQGGKPAFIVIPYGEYLRMVKKGPRIPARDAVPHEVVSIMIDNDWSLLRAWREYLGLTQKEVADRAGITQAALSQMESGEQKMRKITREKLAAAIGLTPEQLAA
jgi:DNA-binding XRE family transcriptional regulator